MKPLVRREEQRHQPAHKVLSSCWLMCSSLCMGLCVPVEMSNLSEATVHRTQCCFSSITHMQTLGIRIHIVYAFIIRLLHRQYSAQKRHIEFYGMLVLSLAFIHEHTVWSTCGSSVSRCRMNCFRYETMCAWSDGKRTAAFWTFSKHLSQCEKNLYDTRAPYSQLPCNDPRVCVCACDCIRSQAMDALARMSRRKIAQRHHKQ